MALKRERIGWDIEDATLTGNKTVTGSKNIIGSNSVLTTNGVATMTLDPIKMNSAHNFSKFIAIASIFDYETDKVKRDFTFIWDFLLYGESKDVALPLAYVETADVEVSDSGPGNEAYQYVTTLHMNGNKTYYTVDFSTSIPTLTLIDNFDKYDTSKYFFEDGIATRSQGQLYFNYEEEEFN